MPFRLSGLGIERGRKRNLKRLAYSTLLVAEDFSSLLSWFPPLLVRNDIFFIAPFAIYSVCVLALFVQARIDHILNFLKKDTVGIRILLGHDKAYEVSFWVGPV